MPRFYLRAFWTFFSLRALSVLLHYLGPSPWGGPLVLSPDRFIPEALVIEAGIWGLFVWLFALLEKSSLWGSWAWPRGPSVLRALFLIAACLFGIFSQVDFEVTRWLGQHMSASYIANFAGARDGKLFARILSGDVLFSSIAFVQMILFVGVGGFLWLRFARDEAMGVLLDRRRALAFLLLTTVALASPFWLRPSEKRWRRLRPASIGITHEAARKVLGFGRPRDPERARQDLIDYVYEGALDRAVTPKNSGYPLYREDNLGQLHTQAFKALASDQKPDVIFIVFETMRGANTGLVGEPHSPLAAMPRLRAQMVERSRYFPRVHSAGYPSVSGAMGMHLGVWPHHSRIVFSSYLHIRSLAFPQILRNAGYKSLALLGADPSFSNFTPWFRRWYDEVEYDPSRHHDAPLVDRFIELYDAKLESSDPLLMTIWTATTHPPYDVPKESGVTPADSNEARYLQAMRYADEHIERLLRHLQNSPRYHRTLVFVVGDHSQPTPWAWTHSEDVGELTAGHTWTSLGIFGGKDVAPEPGRDDRTISHVDLAPTIISAVNLSHGNHFFGRDVLSDDGERSVYSFRYGAMSEERGSRRSIYRIEGGDVLSYAFDRDDPSSYGSLAGGARSPADPLPHIERSRDMARLWGELLSDDRLLPPDASGLE